MTPKEKAKELFNSYEYINKHINKFDTTFHSKMCALIAVEEILDATKVKWNTNRFLPNGECKNWKGIAYKKYWQEVKQEIEKL